jgi:hypothetical protein
MNNAPTSIKNAPTSIKNAPTSQVCGCELESCLLCGSAQWFEIALQAQRKGTNE